MLRYHLSRAVLAASLVVFTGWTAASPAAAEEFAPSEAAVPGATEAPLVFAPTEPAVAATEPGAEPTEPPVPPGDLPPPPGEIPPPDPTGEVPPIGGGRVVPTAPRAPRIGAVKAGQGAARVHWKPPANDGGARISGYIVRAERSGKVVRTGAGTRDVQVSRLRNGRATTFTVAAVNAVGRGPWSRKSAAVTPRQVARFVIKRNAQRRIVYGTPSTVRARLETAAGGVGIRGQRVRLFAKYAPSLGWRQVASGTTNSHGGVALRATLPASAALQLRHPIGAVVAEDRDARPVVVAKRVTASASHTRMRQGMSVTVRGRVAPGQREGSRIKLQRRVGDRWVRVASGNMNTRQRYSIRWVPQQVGEFSMRVKKPGDSARAAGVSRTWRQRVNPENAADVAADILRDKGITLSRWHVTSGADGATPKENIVDVAHGRNAQRSCYGGAPCGSTPMDIRVLKAVREMGTRGTITVSEFAGGRHAGRSAHYSGRGVDINWVNGRHVAWGSGYDMAVRVCRAYGADQVLHPSNDPWGGHHNHVHCGW